MNRRSTGLAENLFGSETLNKPPDSMDVQTIASKFILGTSLAPQATYFEYPSLSSPPDFGPPLNENLEDPSKSIVIDLPLNIIQRRCKEGFRFNISIDVDGDTVTKDVECVRGLYLWRDNSLDIIHELYRGYMPEDSPLQRANEFLGAYDFMDTNENIFNVIIWYNETYKPPAIELVKGLTFIPSIFRSSGVRMLLEFVKEMPIRESFISYANLATIAGPLVFASTIQSFILDPFFETPEDSLCKSYYSKLEFLGANSLRYSCSAYCLLSLLGLKILMIGSE